MWCRSLLRCAARLGRTGPHEWRGQHSTELAPQPQRKADSVSRRRRVRTRAACMPHGSHPAEAEVGPVRRVSLSAQLEGTANASAVIAQGAEWAASTDGVVVDVAEAGTSSSFLQPSKYQTQLAAHHARASQSLRTSSPATAAAADSSRNGSRASNAVSELTQQQTVLRDMFDHAYKHHNIAVKKDAKVYAREVAAFRQAHGGRPPRRGELSPYAHATLAPVAALHALRHVDASKSPLHDAVRDAVILQEAVAKNNLVQSREKTLVRCLACFRVYSAQPRTLWGDDVEQSWIDVEKEKQKAERADALTRNPKRRKRLYSVGRQSARRESSPTCCPQCGSRRAQWLMEYVHHSTHMH